MTGYALVPPLRAVLWDLRAAWATGRRVSVTLEQCDLDRMEGHVHCVAATGAFIVISGRHIPVDRVLAVHLPSRLGDSTIKGTTAWAGARRAPEQAPGQIELDFA